MKRNLDKLDKSIMASKRPRKRIHIEVKDVLAGADVLAPMFNVSTSSRNKYEKSLEHFTTEQRYYHAMCMFFSEVCDGGIHQFFFNSAGCVWEDAVKGFEAANIPRVASILKRAGQRLGGKPAFDRRERWKQLDENEPDFDDLDTEFFSLDEECSKQMDDYVKNNAEKFCFDGHIRR